MSDTFPYPIINVNKSAAGHISFHAPHFVLAEIKEGPNRIMTETQFKELSTVTAQRDRLHDLVCQIWLEIPTTDLALETAEAVREEVAKEYAALAQIKGV